MRKFNNEFIRYIYLSSEIGALYHEAGVKLGLSDSAMNILYTICVIGEKCSQIDICRLSGISRQTINSAIRKLEKEDIVYLEPTGGRNMLVCLTDKGKQVMEEKAYPLVKIENDIFESWTTEEKEMYIRLTQRYRDEMNRKINEL
ncbi:MarR family winged helix-turn-helix transcriptional regulator [Anaerosporobacter sp.]